MCRLHDTESDKCSSKQILEANVMSAFVRLCNKLMYNYKQILLPLQTTLQSLRLRKFSGQTQVMEIHKEIAKLKEQTHVLARLKTKGFLDEAKYIEQTTELTSKINKLQAELKECMAYLMNKGHISPPTSYYYNVIKQGYEANGMDTSYLRAALERSVCRQHFNDEPDEELYEKENFEEDENFDENEYLGEDEDFQMKF